MRSARNLSFDYTTHTYTHTYWMCTKHQPWTTVRRSNRRPTDGIAKKMIWNGRHESQHQGKSTQPAYRTHQKAFLLRTHSDTLAFIDNYFHTTYKSLKPEMSDFYIRWCMVAPMPKTNYTIYWYFLFKAIPYQQLDAYWTKSISVGRYFSQTILNVTENRKLHPNYTYDWHFCARFSRGLPATRPHWA